MLIKHIHILIIKLKKQTNKKYLYCILYSDILAFGLESNILVIAINHENDKMTLHSIL